jgi:hypothetical protein
MQCQCRAQRLGPVTFRTVRPDEFATKRSDAGLLYTCDEQIERAGLFLGAGASCQAAQVALDDCDHRLGLICLPAASGGFACALPSRIKLGESCSVPEGGTDAVVCEDSAFCSGLACVPRSAAGAPCQYHPDSCLPGFVCAGTCVPTQRSCE